MRFEPKTIYYAESAEGYRIIKHFTDGTASYQAWHSNGEWLVFNLPTAKEAANVCLEHYRGG